MACHRRGQRCRLRGPHPAGSVHRRTPAQLRALTALGIDAVLDGELIAGAGRPAEFYELAGAMAARRRDRPLCFVAFDVLRLDGTSLLNVPQQERRQLLQQLAVLADDTLPIVPSYAGADVDEDILAGCEQLALEGVVVERQDARYLPGRRTNGWRKAKAPSWSAHRERRFEHARPRPTTGR